MRRLAAALAALLIACPAVAQQAQSPRALVAPTAPVGDSSDRIASTAFVQAAIGSPLLPNGQFFIGNASNAATAHALTGDCTSNNVGLITCTQSAGAFTVNGQLTVNGAIIDTSGNATLKTVILPGATSGTITVKAADIAGANTITLPAGTTDFSATGGTSRFVAQATVGGPFTVVQPSCASLSGVAASCSTDTTNATNISAGTLGSGRLPAFGSGDVSFAAAGGAGTIANSAVTLAKMANLTGLSVIGNAGTVAAAPTAVTGTTDQIARINTAGTALAFGSINLAGSGAVGASILPLANGGSNAALTASNGGLVFSTGSAFSILAGTATAGQIPRSGASTSPTWSTATYPATSAAGTVLGSTSANVIAATATPVLGAVGTTGTIGLSGTTSGTATITPQATAGTPTITLPNASGTVAVSGTAPVAVSATTGAITCTTCVTSSGGGAITGTAPVVASAAGVVSVQGATGQVLTGSGGTGSAFSATPTLGAVGTQGTLALAGTTSGTVTQTTAAAAGTPTITWGSGTGTPAVTATSPLTITAATGNIALANPLPVANGGTNGTTASGTLLDNITAFASTGFINRTGAGTYSFSTASGILDGIGSTQGNVLFRGAAGWQALATGTAGQVLTTQGAAANPTWTTVTGTGTVTNVATGAGLTGGPITTTGTVTLNGISPQGRLTLTANTPVMTASATNATTLRYDCYNGGLVVYFDGTNDQTETISSCEVTDAMVATATSGGLSANSVFDVWWVHSGANRICVANGAAAGAAGTGWAADTAGSNTARGTGYSQLDKTTRPYVTNKNAITNCWNGATQYGSVAVNQATYLGTIRTLAAGQVSYTLGAFGAGGPATAPAVLLWNQYNRQPWCVAFGDTNPSYAYTTTSWREADGSSTMQVRFVTGQNEGSVTADYDALGNTTTNVGVASIGVDTTSAFTTGATSGLAASTALAPAHASWRALPGLGDHFLAAIELGDTGVAFVGQRVAGQQSGMSVCGQY